jgi:hypothetical protein
VKRRSVPDARHRRHPKKTADRSIQPIPKNESTEIVSNLEIDPTVIENAMQRLVDEGRAEWTTFEGERCLRMTPLGKALMHQRRGEETVQ